MGIILEAKMAPRGLIFLIRLRVRGFCFLLFAGFEAIVLKVRSPKGAPKERPEGAPKERPRRSAETTPQRCTKRAPQRCTKRAPRRCTKRAPRRCTLVSHLFRVLFLFVCACVLVFALCLWGASKPIILKVGRPRSLKPWVAAGGREAIRIRLTIEIMLLGLRPGAEMIFENTSIYADEALIKL